MNRDYILAALAAGRKDRDVLERAGVDSSVVLSLPKGTPPEVMADVLTALRRAYEAGREDKYQEGEAAARPPEPRDRNMIAWLESTGRSHNAFTSRELRLMFSAWEAGMDHVLQARRSS